MILCWVIKMDKYRQQIDKIDKELMALINQRYQVTKAIGKYKKQNNIPITNSKREEEVLAKANNYIYSDEIKAVYQMMFKKNKEKKEIFDLKIENLY